MKSTGLRLRDMLVIMVIVCISGIIFGNIRHRSLEFKCKANLKVFGTSIHIYSNDYGRSVRYPDANGAYFLARLYKVGIITDPKVYLCPATRDDNENCDLGVESGIEPEWISYAARKNKVQTTYPGLYRITTSCPCCSQTSVAADDWETVGNHRNGQYINFLFLPGYVDHIWDTTLTSDDYNAFATKGQKLADPLTN